MKPRILCKCFFAILMLLLFCDNASADKLKTEALEQKSYEISSLRVTIIDKIDQAIERRTYLERRLGGLIGEIHHAQIRFEIHSHPEAMLNLRIRYNLRLIQVLQAYVNRLNERIIYFQTGNERLKYLDHQIKDDMAIINTLEDMEIDNLIDSINVVLEEIIPETKKQTFEASDIRLQPLDLIWDEISNKPS